MPTGLLPREQAEPRAAYRSSQRGRLLLATADVAAERGYGELTVAEIVARAGVSRRAFYEHFADRRAALLAAYDAGTDVMTAQLGETLIGGDTPVAARLRTGLERFLGLMAGDPAAARVALVEILAVGPEGRERYSVATQRFAALLTELQRQARAEDPRIADPGPTAIEAVGGGVNRVVTARVLAGRADELPGLADDLEAFVATVLFRRAS